jgi:hypothetical protein
MSTDDSRQSPQPPPSEVAEAARRAAEAAGLRAHTWPGRPAEPAADAPSLERAEAAKLEEWAAKLMPLVTPDGGRKPLRRLDFLATVFAALAWLIGIALYATSRGGSNTDEPNRLLTTTRHLAMVQTATEQRGTAVPKSIVQPPPWPSTPPPTTAGSDVTYQLAAKIKASNLNEQEKMIIQVTSMLGIGEFCLGQGVDYRDLAEAMIAGWRRNSLSDDLLTQMSIDFGAQIGREGRVYDFREGTVVDLATMPDPKSNCELIHHEVVRISEMNKNPPPPATPAAPDQGRAEGEGTSAGNPSEAPRTIVPEAASIGGPVEVARSESGRATGMPSGEGPGGGAVRLPDDTLVALLRRGDEMLALGDLSAARLLYERAATGGSARAATAAGKTYDPIFFKDTGVRGTPPDAVKALAWYRRAIELGDSEAVARLKKLEADAGQ